MSKGLRKQRIGEFESLLLPTHQAKTLPLWPTCMTCGAYADSMETVETGRLYAKVLIKHHGQEQLVTVDFDAEGWTYQDLGKCLRALRLFDPNTHETK